MSCGIVEARKPNGAKGFIVTIQGAGALDGTYVCKNVNEAKGLVNDFRDAFIAAQ